MRVGGLMTKGQLITVLLLTSALLSIGARVHAQEANPERERALDLFDQGNVAYEAGRFSEAAELFREAYETFQEPILLYNLARAAESDGDLESARDSYEGYLTSDPEDAEVVRARIERIDEQIAERERLEREREEALSQEAVVIVEAPSRGGPIAFMVAGGAALVGGAVAIGWGQGRAREANDLELLRDDAEQQHAQGVRANTAGFAVAGVGVAALLVGVIWRLTQRDPESVRASHPLRVRF